MLRKYWNSIIHEIHTILCTHKDEVIAHTNIERYNGGDISPLFRGFFKLRCITRDTVYRQLLKGHKSFIIYLGDIGFFEYYVSLGEPASYSNLGIC